MLVGITHQTGVEDVVVVPPAVEAEDAYESGMTYDVTDMRNAVLAFAANSTNQADYCIKLFRLICTLSPFSL